MIIQLLPAEDNALIVYKGSPITNPVCNAELTDWNAFHFEYSFFQHEGGFIEFDFTSIGLSRKCSHENLVWSQKLQNTAI